MQRFKISFLCNFYANELENNDLQICGKLRKNRDPDWIRTNDLQLRRLPLYPAELRDQWMFGGCKDNFF